MESYPIDINPGQLVRWIKAEIEAEPGALNVTGSRTQSTKQIPRSGELHLGDEEREELSEVETIATLEIAPAHASEGWLLTVVVADEVGPRMAIADAAPQAEQEIDLGTFYKEFVRLGRGEANIIAEVRDAAAKDRLTRLIEAVETNRHAKTRPAATR